MDFIDFLLISGTHSESFFVLLDKRNGFVHIYFLVDFSDDVGSEFGCLGLQKQAFGKRGMQKSTFTKIGFLMIPGSIFHDFG